MTTRPLWIRVEPRGPHTMSIFARWPEGSPAMYSYWSESYRQWLPLKVETVPCRYANEHALAIVLALRDFYSLPAFAGPPLEGFTPPTPPPEQRELIPL